MAISEVKGRVPPAAALLERIEGARRLLPFTAQLVMNPLLDTFAAYVAATEQRIATLEQVPAVLAEAHLLRDAGKDLSRGGIAAALVEMAHGGGLEVALSKVKEGG